MLIDAHFVSRTNFARNAVWYRKAVELESMAKSFRTCITRTGNNSEILARSARVGACCSWCDLADRATIRKTAGRQTQFRRGGSDWAPKSRKYARKRRTRKAIHPATSPFANVIFTRPSCGIPFAQRHQSRSALMGSFLRFPPLNSKALISARTRFGRRKISPWPSATRENQTKKNLANKGAASGPNIPRTHTRKPSNAPPQHGDFVSNQGD